MQINIPTRLGTSTKRGQGLTGITLITPGQKINVGDWGQVRALEFQNQPLCWFVCASRHV